MIDWGDGHQSSGLNASHTYANEGVYTVTVTVTDDDGGVGVDTLIVTIGNAPPVITSLPPRASGHGLICEGLICRWAA